MRQDMNDLNKKIKQTRSHLREAIDLSFEEPVGTFRIGRKSANKIEKVVNVIETLTETEIEREQLTFIGELFENTSITVNIELPITQLTSAEIADRIEEELDLPDVKVSSDKGSVNLFFT